MNAKNAGVSVISNKSKQQGLELKLSTLVQERARWVALEEHNAQAKASAEMQAMRNAAMGMQNAYTGFDDRIHAEWYATQARGAQNAYTGKKSDDQKPAGSSYPSK